MDNKKLKALGEIERALGMLEGNIVKRGAGDG